MRFWWWQREGSSSLTLQLCHVWEQNGPREKSCAAAGAVPHQHPTAGNHCLGVPVGAVVLVTFAPEMSPPTPAEAHRSHQWHSTQELFLYLCRADLCLFSSLDFDFP